MSKTEFASKDLKDRVGALETLTSNRFVDMGTETASSTNDFITSVMNKLASDSYKDGDMGLFHTTQQGFSTFTGQYFRWNKNRISATFIPQVSNTINYIWVAQKENSTVTIKKIALTT